LKEREDLLNRYGTTTETAQASYQVRVLLRNLKENAAELQKIYDKDAKRVRFFAVCEGLMLVFDRPGRSDYLKTN
jgi:hypothetical protein